MSSSLQISKHRLEALSDGIYAVALTLLALDLKLAALPQPTNAALGMELANLLPKALIWLLAFWVTVLFWLAQSRALRQYHELDKPAVLIELAQLALITLLPFTCSLMAEHGDLGTAALVYSLHLTLLSALSWQRIARLLRNPGLRSADGFDEPVARLHLQRARVVMACALVTVALAWWVPAWNMLAMIGIALHRRASEVPGAARA
ncbi:MAG: TMEM175 family protein [Burkholderiaceae bacterium]